MLPAYTRLDLTWGQPSLLSALSEIPEQAWQTHFNSHYHNNAWSSVTLLGADTVNAAPNLDQAAHAAQPSAWFSPSWQAILAPFELTLVSARLMRLASGGVINEHTDPDLGHLGDVRLHIPITSEAGVEFLLDGHAIPMQVGECWLLDLSKPHRVYNKSANARVHLVIDAKPNWWLQDLVARSQANTPVATLGKGPQAFATFAAALAHNPSQSKLLQSFEQPQDFISQLIALGATQQCNFDEQDVLSAMRRGKRAWIEQWIV